jgi:hypothetical protein
MRLSPASLGTVVSGLEREDEDHRYSVKWYVNAVHERGGMIRGRTFYVSTAGLLLRAPVRYRVGDRIDLEIFVRTTLSVRCKGRVAASGTPYQIEFVEFGMSAFVDTGNPIGLRPFRFS